MATPLSRRPLVYFAGAAALVALLLLSGCPRTGGTDEIEVTVTDEGGGQAQKGNTPAELLKLARNEGEVTWYTSLAAAQADTFIKLFAKKYPGVMVRLERGGTFGLIERIEREIDTSQPHADVLHVLDPAIFVTLRQRVQLAAYDSPSAASIPPEYKDPAYWTAARLVPVVIAYNPKKISPDAAPRGWSDLLNRRFKGRLGLKDAQTAGSAYAQYYFLRIKYGVSYWEQLAKLSPRIYKTEEDLLAALKAGEIQVAAGIMPGTVAEGSAASALRVVWPSDGVPLVPGPVGILSNAPHPNAARLFADFALSQEGQKALSELLGAYSARPDVGAPAGWPTLAALPLLRPESGWAEYLEKQGSLRAEYSRLFHGESE